MTLHFLHNLSGYAIILFLLGKVILHYSLDHLHDRSIGLSSILLMPRHYLSLYTKTVNSAYQILKYLCNVLLILTCISLAINIIVGLLIYSS